MAKALLLPCVVVAASVGTLMSLRRTPAQPGPVAVTFTGQVVTGKSKSPARYGQVSVVGTSVGTLVDTLGHYSFSAQLTPGEYRLRVVAIGFNPASQAVVVKDSGEIRVPAIAIAEATIALEDLMVQQCWEVSKRPRKRPRGVSISEHRDSTGNKVYILCRDPR